MAITDNETISINYIDDEIILCTLKDQKYQMHLIQ